LIDLFWVNGCHPEGICRQHINGRGVTNNAALDKRNPLPLTVSCASLGHEGPTVYIQTKEKKERKKNKNKNKLFHVQTKNPGGLSNIPPYT
jgi:sugar lactone lactonase YvrE